MELLDYARRNSDAVTAKGRLIIEAGLRARQIKTVHGSFQFEEGLIFGAFSSLNFASKMIQSRGGRNLAQRCRNCFGRLLCFAAQETAFAAKPIPLQSGPWSFHGFLRVASDLGQC